MNLLMSDWIDEKEFVSIFDIISYSTYNFSSEVFKEVIVLQLTINQNNYANTAEH